MQHSKVVETWVGLFVAMGMVGLFFLAMKVSNLGDLQSKDNSFKLTARFQNVGSLRERAPVSMAGVRVGRVNSIHFDKATYEAVVEMRIDPEFDTIPTDTTATVLTAGLLGEQYIGLSAGGADEFLKEGDEIELTQSAMVLEEVISRFLFNKAESGSEKKDPPAVSNAPEQDAEPDTSVAEDLPAEAERPENGEEEPATEEAGPTREPQPAHKAKRTPAAEGEPAHAKPPKASNDAKHEPKAAQGKAQDAANSAHKVAKPGAQGSSSAH